jgi:hypothetical protein
MTRNSEPRSIEELERDDAVYGPAPRQEELRMLVNLSTMSVKTGQDHVARSKALLARIAAKFPQMSR